MCLLFVEESAFPVATKFQKTNKATETVIAQGPGKSHPSHSTPTDIKKNSHWAGAGDQHKRS